MKYVISAYILMIAGLIIVSIVGCSKTEIVFIPEEVTCETTDVDNGFIIECSNGTIVVFEREDSFPGQCRGHNK